MASQLATAGRGTAAPGLLTSGRINETHARCTRAEGKEAGVQLAPRACVATFAHSAPPVFCDILHILLVRVYRPETAPSYTELTSAPRNFLASLAWAC